MKLSKLLASRQALLRQTQLANLSYAYISLRCFAQRIASAKLRGLVKLRPADPADDCFWASLTALEGNQSVIEEHFTDRELIELSEAMELALDRDYTEIDFRLEELGDRYVQPLRQMLEDLGVVFDTEDQPNLTPEKAE